MDIKRNSPRNFFGRTKAMFGERMEDYARTARESYPNDQTNFEELEQFRQEKRDSEDKRKFIFRIATVLFGLIFLYVFLRLAARDILTIFY